MNWDRDAALRFWRFVADRQRVFVKRVLRREPPPWTDDATLAGVYFTNVYRELDRGTRYLINNILPYSAEDPIAPPDVLFSVVVYRLFNWIPTYEALTTEFGEPFLRAQTWDPERAIALLDARQKAGNQITTGAYMINATGAVGPGSKNRLMVGRVENVRRDLDGLFLRLVNALGMESAHEALCRYDGISGFNAYEMVIDLCYPPVKLLPFEENDWVNPGPGAIHGLESLLTDRPITRPLAQAAIEYLRVYQDRYLRMAKVELLGPPLTLRNVEHSLCEFHKYVRASAGGRSKRLYNLRKADGDLTPWANLPEAFTRWA